MDFMLFDPIEFFFKWMALIFFSIFPLIIGLICLNSFLIPRHNALIYNCTIIAQGYSTVISLIDTGLLLRWKRWSIFVEPFDRLVIIICWKDFEHHNIHYAYVENVLWKALMWCVAEGYG